MKPDFAKSGGNALGVGLALFSFAPVLGIVTGLSNLAFYVGGLVVIAAAGIAPLLFAKPVTKLGAGWWALVALLVVILLWSPTFSRDSQWLALLSVFLSVIAVASVTAHQREHVVQGIVLGVVVIGVIVSLFTAYDSRFVLMKGGGWVEGNLGYLLLAAPVAVSVGPVILHSFRGRLKIFWLVASVLIVVGVVHMLARTAVVSAVATGALAVLFLLHRKSKLATLLKGAALVMPLAPLLLMSIVNSNAGLNRRFERMLNPVAELQEGGRGYIWERTADLISERPILGWGVQGLQNEIGNHPHNAILEAWGDLGIPGLLAVGLVYLLFFLSMIRTVFRIADHHIFALHLITFVLAVESLKSQSLYLSRATLILLVLTPILARISHPRLHARAITSALPHTYYEGQILRANGSVR